MSCGIRVYKGEELELSLPFNISGASNIMVSLYTDGEYSVEKSGEVEDGKIGIVLDSADLDLLQDGAIRYTISYELDGDEKNLSSTTMNYLKTPAGYSAVTAEDIYQSGYTAGQQSGSGDCSYEIEMAYQRGYMDGLDDCSGGTGEGRYAIAQGSFYLPNDVVIEGALSQNFIFYAIDAAVTTVDNIPLDYGYTLVSGQHYFRTALWAGVGMVASFPIEAVGIGEYSPSDINLTYKIWLNKSH